MQVLVGSAWIVLLRPQVRRSYHLVAREMDLLVASQVTNTNEQRTEAVGVYGLWKGDGWSPAVGCVRGPVCAGLQGET